MLDVIVPIIVAIIASGTTYFVARRKGSGRIETSEAADLWAESQAMRRELRDEVKDLRAQIKDLRAHIIKLEQELEARA